MDRPAPKRDARGLWLPGQSANPAGRPRDSYEIQALARSYAPKALQTLVDIAADKTLPPAARVSAAQALLDRGYGRPMQQVEAKIEAVDMGAAHLAALQELATLGLRDRQDAATIEGVAVRVED